MNRIKWNRVWDWSKKIGGVVITMVVTPYVTARYGQGWGAVVGTIGTGAAIQSRRFGDQRKINELKAAQVDIVRVD